MKKPNTFGRARLVAVALAIAAAGVFASVGMAGFGPALVSLSHKNKTPTTDQYPTSKVTICHHTHSQKNPFVTITVSENAVAAHVQNHGDTIGPCPAQPPAAAVVPGAAKAHKAHKAHKAAKGKAHLKGKSKAKHEGQGKNDGAKGVGHKPTTGPSTAEHGNGKGKGHTKTHGPPADRGQGKANGHGQSQTNHGQGHSDTHGKSGGGGNGKEKGH